MGHIVTILKSVKDTSAGFHRPVDQILKRIKKGESKDKIEAIRKEDNSDKRNELKIKLPAICFSGTFNQRADKAMLEHSGLICLDFDKFPDAGKLNKTRAELVKDKYTFSLFTSPSGNGLKVIVKIPPEKESHREYFKALEHHYDSEYFDPSCVNESRVCYESYDPDIFINEKSEVFSDKIEDPHYTVGIDSPVVPVKSENQIIQKLQKWFDNNFPMVKGQRNENLFKLARAFNSFGVNQYEAERVLLSYQSDGFTQREIENVTRSAYSYTSEHGTKFFEDNYTRDKLEKSIRSGNDMKRIKSEFKEVKNLDDVIEKVKKHLNVTEFWEYTKSGKVTLSHHKYKRFLEQNGFYKIFPSGADMFVFVKKQDNIISNTSTAIIKDFVLDYLLNYEGGLLPYDYMAGATKFFKEDYLSLIDTADIQMNEDTRGKCYLYYKNCAVEITKDGVQEIDYLNLDGFIWEKHIINREYKQEDSTGCEFEKFINLVAGKDPDRVRSLYSVIGYLLHSFKNPSDNKAIIFNDEIISDNPNGGSGKGIISNALSHIKRVTTLDGKQFDFDKSFPYQTVSADTQVLVFDDVKKNFSFENLFSLVTEGITLEKKNKDAIKLPVEKSPKILITTNYTIKGEGGSFERRKFEVELSSYFNDNYSPIQEFGHMLFDDWNADEWHKFDSFMILCIQFYLKKGLIPYKHHNLETRKFINNTSHEFYEWAESDNIPIDEPIEKPVLFDQFIDEYPDYRKFLTRRKFWQWVDMFGKYKKYHVVKFKSNGQRMVKLESPVQNNNKQTPF